MKRSVALVLVVLMVAVACVPPPPPPPPLGNGAIEIEQGRAAINRTAVEVRLTVPEGATQVRIANGTNPTSAPWQTVSATRSWQLTPGDGTKTVSAQFRRGDTTATAVTDTILLDTVPPQITVAELANGALVDLSDGEFQVWGGAVSDPGGSGVADVATNAGGVDVEAESTDGGWYAPLSAPTSGTHTYVATATDAAGNSASVTRQFQVVLPAPDETVVRPGVLVVDGTLGEALLDDGTDGEQLVFSGDRRAELGDAQVLVSAPLTASETGLLRRVAQTRYDAATDQTVVETSYGGLLDVYAQLRIDTLAPAGSLGANGGAGLRSGSSPEPCDDFVRGKTIGDVIELPELGGSFAVPPPGPSEWTAGATATGEVGLFLDLRIDIGFGFTGVDVREFFIEAGVLLCGEINAVAEVTNRQILGPEFDVGMPYSEAKGRLAFEPQGPGVGWKPSWLPGNNLLDPVLPAIPCANPIQQECPRGFVIPGSPVPLYWAPTLKPTAVLDLTAAAEMSVGAKFEIGARFGVDGTDPFLDLIGDGRVGDMKASVEASAYFGLGGKFGVKLGESALGAASGNAGLGDLTRGIRTTVKPSWRDGIVSATSAITSLEISACGETRATLGVTLDLALKAPSWVPIFGGQTVTVTPLDFGILEWNEPDPPGLNVDPIPGGPSLPPGLGGVSYCWSDEFQAGELAITPPDPPTGRVSETYGPYQLESSHQANWIVVDGDLPPGLTLSSNGRITGTPTTAGEWQATIRARDALQTAREIDITIRIAPASTPTLTFGYTGAPQSWVVPPGVTSVMVDMAGGSGGDEWAPNSQGVARGGRIRGVLDVTPGQVLQINVGGAGGSGAPGVAGAGGWNGGADGGGTVGGNPVGGGGGGGGGATDIRISGTDLSSRVLVAGGGGGNGANWGSGHGGRDASRGGHGGSLTGQAGQAGASETTSDAGGLGGEGGGLSGPIAGGKGHPDLGGSGDGESGSCSSGGVGGQGGDAGGNYNGQFLVGIRSGGGGGGGYCGGGGGGGAVFRFSAGGGGGGSSWSHPGLASAVAHTQGHQIGNGYVHLFFNAPKKLVWAGPSECSGPGQACNLAGKIDFNLTSPRDVQLDVAADPNHCSSVRYRVSVNGGLRTFTSFMRFAGATGEFANLPESEEVNLGLLPAGDHSVTVGIEGQPSGCNSGVLRTASGFLTFPEGIDATDPVYIGVD
jgi:hypothetical protein